MGASRCHTGSLAGWFESLSHQDNFAGFGPVTVLSGNGDTAAGGTPWTFDTSGLVQCGYVVRGVARDRAIVGSIANQHSRSTDVGFCVLEG